MKKTLKYLVFVSFLIVIFTGPAYALQLKPAVPGSIDEETCSEVPLATEKKVSDLRPTIQYQATGLRNPFEQTALFLDSGESAKGASKEQALPVMVVQGVIWGGNYPQAIVNNKVVKVGDTLEGVEIIEIGREGVVVLFSGVEYKLSTIPVMGQRKGAGKN